MLTIQIGRKKNSGLPNPNAHPLSLCGAVQLDRIFGEEADAKVLSLSFNWVTEDPESGSTGTGSYILPLTGNGMPKPTMGVFFLTHNSKPITVTFENVKEAITVECIGKMVPYDFTLKYKVLR